MICPGTEAARLGDFSRHLESSQRGVTLIELVVVVTIMVILAAVTANRMGNLIQISKEGNMKANLGQVRSALTIYYSDNTGIFPVGSPGANQTTLYDTLTPKYLGQFPGAEPYPYHAPSFVIDNITDPSIVVDGGQWGYVADDSSSNWGSILIECTHLDNQGRPWSSF